MSGMSKKYIVLADVEGKIRTLFLRFNGPRGKIEELCREMAEQLFRGQEVRDLRVGLWPLDEVTRQELCLFLAKPTGTESSGRRDPPDQPKASSG